jgi:hypothetical protein
VDIPQNENPRFREDVGSSVREGPYEKEAAEGKEAGLFQQHGHMATLPPASWMQLS